MSNSYFGGYHCINVTSQKQLWRHPEGGILACTSRVSAEASETHGHTTVDLDLDATNIFQLAVASPNCTQNSSKLLGFMEVHSPNFY